MKLTPYLGFDGNCREAFEFYAALTGAKIVAMTTYGETPGCEGMPAGERERILHARLEIGEHALMATDSTSAHPYRKIQGAWVVLDVDTAQEAERLFAAFADGGVVEMPMQETFWAHRYGIVVDRFGVSWMVNCVKPCGP